MEKRRKNNIRLKKSSIELLYNQYPDLFEVTNEIYKMEIKYKFAKIPIKPEKVMKLILKMVGFHYYGYMSMLIDYMHYDNSVSIMSLLEHGIGKAMIEQKIATILRNAGLIKKHLGVYYINPLIAIKGSCVNKDLISLFEKENKELYGIKF